MNKESIHYIFHKIQSRSQSPKISFDWDLRAFCGQVEG